MVADFLKNVKFGDKFICKNGDEVLFIGSPNCETIYPFIGMNYAAPFYVDEEGDCSDNDDLSIVASVNVDGCGNRVDGYGRIEICGKFYTKKDLRTKCSLILAKYADGSRLDSRDEDFVLSVFRMHKNSEKKLEGYSYTTVDIDSYGYRCFYIHYEDGGMDDISISKCLTATPTRKKEVVVENANSLKGEISEGDVFYIDMDNLLNKYPFYYVGNNSKHHGSLNSHFDNMVIPFENYATCGINESTYKFESCVLVEMVSGRLLFIKDCQLRGKKLDIMLGEVERGFVQSE